MEDEIKQKGADINKKVILRRTGCHGYCERGPIIVIYPQEICYLVVKKEDVAEIVDKTLKGEMAGRLLYKGGDGKPVVKKSDIPFYKFQKMVLLKDIPKINPTNIDDYIRIGG